MSKGPSHISVSYTHHCSLHKELDRDHVKYYGNYSSITAVPFVLSGVKLFFISQVNWALYGKENLSFKMLLHVLFILFQDTFSLDRKTQLSKWYQQLSCYDLIGILCSLESGSLRNCQLLHWLSLLSFDLHFTFLTCIGRAVHCSVGGAICHLQHQLMSQEFIDLFGPCHLNFVLLYWF